VLQTVIPKSWAPTDGDTFVTKEGLIFNVFGYEHPSNRVFSFLKYIPSRFKTLFHVRFLERTWKFEKLKLFRAEKLYTAQNYQTFVETFRNNFPNYIYFCPFRKKEVISTPLSSIKKVYVPKGCLRSLIRIERKDSLQEITLNLVDLLSSESNITVEDFGVHGSIALDMHTPQSDIDLVVYGAHNFRKLEKAIDKLVKAGTLSYVFTNRLDAARRCKGRYLNKIFMYNSVRKPEEVNSKYGTNEYSPLFHTKFHCRVKDDSEAMFRPSIYKIENFKADNTSSTLSEDRIPKLVVSMIGCYRNVAKKGDELVVSGTLERVENIETGEVFHQVVVGTAANEDEYIWPL
jgi:predicted nucleotidyltransferase